MLLISHRGNLDGSDPATENSVGQITKAMSAGFQVEIDVRFIYDKFYLGHDLPQYEVDPSFFREFSDRLWCHAKNIEALEKMLDLGLHCFWHEDDRYTLTSKGIIWAYPDYYTNKGILVMPSKNFIANLSISIYGICVDDPVKYL
jgi:hypothetical protein